LSQWTPGGRGSNAPASWPTDMGCEDIHVGLGTKSSRNREAPRNKMFFSSRVVDDWNERKAKQRQ